ncbi:MAG: hypothetical protein CMJ32_01265 [Phycisphaerae bacterium]|nr:hypothetical protein [Phycisphaerae bacterium]
MPNNDEHPIELNQSHVEWLDEMVQSHGLPDRSKAIRCLLNFARERTDLESEIFDEIRCPDC